MMAGRLVDANPLSDPMLGYTQLDPKENNSVNISRNLNIFIQENAYENVVTKVAAILSQPQVLNQ